MSGSYQFVPTLDVPYDNAAWRSEAACRGEGDLMFNKATEETAIAICGGCPVFDECDTYASEFRPPAGVWAGVESKERERLRKQVQRRASRK